MIEFLDFAASVILGIVQGVFYLMVILACLKYVGEP